MLDDFTPSICSLEQHLNLTSAKLETIIIKPNTTNNLTRLRTHAVPPMAPSQYVIIKNAADMQPHLSVHATDFVKTAPRFTGVGMVWYCTVQQDIRNLIVLYYLEYVEDDGYGIMPPHHNIRRHQLI